MLSFRSEAIESFTKISKFEDLEQVRNDHVESETLRGGGFGLLH